MKTWKIPVTWEMYGNVVVEAPTLQEAMDIARDDDGVIPLPNDSYYVDGSWRLSYDMSQVEEVRDLLNSGQEDCVVAGDDGGHSCDN
jgi:hypothetical protein